MGNLLSQYRDVNLLPGAVKYGDLPSLLALCAPTPVRKRVFLRHLYIKMITLPRQARDKHRESTQKEPFMQVDGVPRVLLNEKPYLLRANTGAIHNYIVYILYTPPEPFN